MLPAKTVQAPADINTSVNYQGRLLNTVGAVVADANYSMQFKIYKDGPGNEANDTGGTLLLAAAIGTNKGSGLGAIPGNLLTAWPLYFLALLMVFMYWMGERVESAHEHRLQLSA